MTTDTTALQERIKRALWEALPDVPEEDYGSVEPWLVRDAAAVLPIIAAEVQAAKAEALREAAGPEWGNNNTLWSGPRVRAKITRRATKYETGDRA